MSKSYVLDEVVVDALCGVDLEVRRGEMLAIMGPSGSGKSTLMHIVGLLDHPTNGHRHHRRTGRLAHVAERSSAAVRNKRIGFVFQSFNLLARTTAQRERGAAARVRGRLRRGARRDAREALEHVGLGDRLDTCRTSFRAVSSSASRSPARS